MQEQNPPYTFLLIDDQQDQMEGLRNAGRFKSILIESVDNMEEGLIWIKREPKKYQALILDANCKRGLTDQSATMNESALNWFLTELRDYERKSNQYFARCIYTAVPKSAEIFRSTETVFIKGRVGEEDQLLDFLTGEVNMNPTRIVEQEFADSLDLCNDHYLPKAKREALLTLLQKRSSTETTEVEQFMQGVRKFLEDMYLRMHAVDKEWLPAELLPRRRPSMTWCSIYLSGREVKDTREQDKPPVFVCKGLSGVPSYISNAVQFLTHATHTVSHTGTFQPSRFALRGLVFTLLEVLNWFKSEVDKRTP